MRQVSGKKASHLLTSKQPGIPRPTSLHQTLQQPNATNVVELQKLQYLNDRLLNEARYQEKTALVCYLVFMVNWLVRRIHRWWIFCASRLQFIPISDHDLRV